ncbi:MAG: HepT-like ribonuclease domain-containing protein [Pseudonocardiaceae bacterium]
MPRDNLYLVEIVEAIDRISRWLSGIDADGWDDDMLRAAVLQQLTTIGEASRCVNNELHEQYPEIPWRRIADFRNVAVHEYFSVDWSLDWRLVQDGLPMLRHQITKVIKVEFPDIGERFNEGKQ